MNKKEIGAGAALVALVALHVAASVFFPGAVLRTALIVSVDVLAVALYRALFSRGRGTAGAVPADSGLQGTAAGGASAGGTVAAGTAATLLPLDDSALAAGLPGEDGFSRVSAPSAENASPTDESVLPFLRDVSGSLDDLRSESARLNETASLMENIRVNIEGVITAFDSMKQNADQVTGVANLLSDSAEKGFELSQNVQTEVSSLAESVASSIAETRGLLEESEKISEILTIMSSIAATTNVLSINASIVAARAGIKGKEFEVVAREIRKLSVVTDDSLNNIATLIKNIQRKIVSVSDKLSSVSGVMMSEKDAMLSVAGSLQGITLSIQVIQSASGVTGEKAIECGKDVSDTLSQIDNAIDAIRLVNSETKIRAMQEQLSALLDGEKKRQG